MNLIPIKTNMTEIQINNTKILFSYKTPVAYYNLETGKMRRTSKKWSQTTTRHINKWLLEVLPSYGFEVIEGMPEEQSFFDSLTEAR